jgi:hypothetical protein
LTEKKATLFERVKRDRWTLVIGILALGILGIAAAATLFRETLLSDLAWESQLELERGSKLLQAEIAPDGSLWVLVEQQDPYSAEIRQFENGEAIQSAKLADDPILRAALERNDGQISFFSSMAIDNSGKLWLNLGSGETVSWDGERWTSAAGATGSETRVEELKFGAASLWALLSSQSGLLAIDPRTGESRPYPLEFEFPDGSVELLPDMLSASHDGGIVVAGAMNPVGLGLLSLDLNGNPSVLTFIPDPKSVGARKLLHVTGDGKGQIHLIYEFAEPCSNGFRRIKSGTRLADAQWVWRDLAYEADCSVRAGSDSIAVDPLGRTWIESSENGVYVFEAPSHQPLDGPLEPSIHYTEENSGFNGRELVQMPTGRILTASTFGRELVSIDAAQEELPAPLPEPLAWLIANSSLILFLTIPLLGILIWRQNKANFGRN